VALSSEVCDSEHAMCGAARTGKKPGMRVRAWIRSCPGGLVLFHVDRCTFGNGMQIARANLYLRRPASGAKVGEIEVTTTLAKKWCA
jgi:hypothetical protein